MLRRLSGSPGVVLGLVFVTAALLLLGACRVPPPVYVLEAPPGPMQVPEAPPPLRLEVPPPPPDESYVWQPGYWAWDGIEYQWVEGSWAPPREGYVLMAASYNFYDGSWHYRAPYWCPRRMCGEGRRHPTYARAPEPSFQPAPQPGGGEAPRPPLPPVQARADAPPTPVTAKVDAPPTPASARVSAPPTDESGTPLPAWDPDKPFKTGRRPATAMREEPAPLPSAVERPARGSGADEPTPAPPAARLQRAAPEEEAPALSPARPGQIIVLRPEPLPPPAIPEDRWRETASPPAPAPVRGPAPAWSPPVEHRFSAPPSPPSPAPVYQPAASSSGPVQVAPAPAVRAAPSAPSYHAAPTVRAAPSAPSFQSAPAAAVRATPAAPSLHAAPAVRRR